MKTVIICLSIFLVSKASYSQSKYKEDKILGFTLSVGTSTAVTKPGSSTDYPGINYSAELELLIKKTSSLILQYGYAQIPEFSASKRNNSYLNFGLKYLLTEKFYGIMGISAYKSNYDYTGYGIAVGSEEYYGSSSMERIKGGINFGMGLIAPISNKINLQFDLRYHVIFENEYSFLVLNAGLSQYAIKNQPLSHEKYNIRVFSGAWHPAGNFSPSGIALQFGADISNKLYYPFYGTAGLAYSSKISKTNNFLAISYNEKLIEVYSEIGSEFGSNDLKFFLESGPALFFSNKTDYYNLKDSEAKTLAGLNFGAGTEISVTEKTSVFLRYKYNLLFNEEQNYTSFNTGLKFNL